MTDLEQQLTDHLRERAAAAVPQEDLAAVEAGVRSYAPLDLEERRRRRPLVPVLGAVAAALALIVGIAVVLSTQDDDDTTPVTVPAAFVSPRNGYAIGDVDGLDRTVTPATQLWGLGQGDDGFDVLADGTGTVFTGTSGDLRWLSPGSGIDARIDEFFSDEHVLPGGCGVPRGEQEEITIDGEAGRVATCADRIEATVVAGTRLYLFTLTSDRADARAVFDDVVATIDLRPETAVEFPGSTTTFVSPTNGVAFGYVDRGGLEPATEPWDPAVDQVDGNQDDGYPNSEGFDGVETAMGAYFLAASTPISEGVPVDDWIDDVIESGGCGVPRSEQEAITIDGQPGTVAECRETGRGRIEATVVDGGRLYLFTLLHDRPDARAFFDAWIATIDLRPETSAVASPT